MDKVMEDDRVQLFINEIQIEVLKAKAVTDSFVEIMDSDNNIDWSALVLVMRDYLNKINEMLEDERLGTI